ncbi:N-acetylglucosamine-6-phosphate deacetylase [Sanguibacter suaedae]|uniref:Amidohydrolase family protein n=1 Tax=Sanguibacter suaedae TaxID=2795737 RepID=A0A934I9Q3_9MICO|nr:amidohydrolase family protein [Sanguibacter suaedae]MBI9113805.1 amidohydrolase family protein [Sanguibacter suaedae]
MSQSSSVLVTGGDVHTGHRVLPAGWVAVVDGRVAQVGTGDVPDAWSALPAVDARGRTVVPGFVDIHTHGAAGATFGSATATGSVADDALRALHLQRRHGTTTTVASLVTAALPTLAEALAELRGLVEDDELAGVHLEGPWLSPDYRGAHDPALLVAPDPGDVDALLGTGIVRVVTLAPEAAGGLDAVRRVVGHGAVAAVGHTAADATVATAAVDAGARLATHLFNAMPPVHHRDPGPVLALLEDERVAVELVADGVHLHPLTLAHAARSAGPARTVLVTDAMAATGMPDGGYVLGELLVDVDHGVARLREGGAIAGSTLTLDAALRHATATAGVPFVDALAALTTTPAGIIGRDDVGILEPGAHGDLVVLDDALRVAAVYRRGRLVGDA